MGASMKYFVLIGAALLQTLPALAEPVCPMCRGQSPVASCDAALVNRPPFDTIGLSGRVTGSEKFSCATRLSIDVVRSTNSNLPAKVQVDIGPCSIWKGKAGDPIVALVFARPSPQTGAYQIRSCN